jgi:hypothetical protein
VRPRRARAILNVTNIEKRGRRRRMPTDVGRRRHRGETAEDEEGDATPDRLLKHTDATLSTYV